MKSLPCMAEIPFVDVDYCQFTDWTGPWGFQKPTRVWGGPHIVALKTECGITPRVLTPWSIVEGGCTEKSWEAAT